MANARATRNNAAYRSTRIVAAKTSPPARFTLDGTPYDQFRARFHLRRLHLIQGQRRAMTECQVAAPVRS